MAKKSSSTKDSVKAELKKVYLSDPLIRYMASHPVRAAIAVHVLLFWSLFLVNWLSDSLLWLSRDKYKYIDILFLNRPLDWFVICLFVPLSVWALGHYYRSLHQGMEELMDEGIVKPFCIEKAIADWKDRKVSQIIRSSLWSAGYAIPIYLFVFMYESFASQVPHDKGIWFLDQHGTPNLMWDLYSFLWAIIALIAFVYITYTIKLAIFHFRLVRQESKTKDSTGLGFFTQHPDGAFGYELLAPSMNWAGIAGLFAFISILISIVNKAVLGQQTSAEGWFDPLVVVNSLLIFVFFPWVILGPVSPFISMLSRKKRGYLLSLRTRVMSSSHKEGDPIRKEWERVVKGRPYIIKKESVFIIAVTIFLVQLPQFYEVLMSLTKWMSQLK